MDGSATSSSGHLDGQLAAEMRRIEETWRPDDEVVEDCVTADPVLEAAAILNRVALGTAAGDRLPTYWHWFFARSHPYAAQIGEDGNALDRDFIPPLCTRNRLFAGGRLDVVEPLKIGDQFTRVSRLASCTLKRGRSGPLLFVTVERSVSVGGQLRLREEQDYVYLGSGLQGLQGSDEPSSSPRVAPAVDGDLLGRARVHADSVLLFRLSALTGNLYRLHYDHPYATKAAGHAGLAIHGPLSVLLMVEALGHEELTLARVEWRAHRPLYAPTELVGWAIRRGDAVTLAAGPVLGDVAVSGSVTLKPDRSRHG